MKVWVATEMYPESTEILVGATEDAALREIVRFIGRDEFDGFVASLRGDEQTSVTYDDPAREVLAVWAGEIEAAEDGDGFFVGGEWFVREVEVAA